MKEERGKNEIREIDEGGLIKKKSIAKKILRGNEIKLITAWYLLLGKGDLV